MSDNDTMNVDEVLAHIMKARGCSRRQARRELWAAIRSGKLPVSGINPQTGKRETIPVDAFEGGTIVSTRGERVGFEQ